MSAIATQLAPASEPFAANAAAMRTLVADLRELSAKIATGGSEAARRKHHERGKLLVRERIDALIDPGSPFLEVAPLAAHGMFGGEVPSARLDTGIFVLGPKRGMELVERLADVEAVIVDQNGRIHI